MSMNPDFVTMTTPQLRAYVLEHREDEESLQAFLDRRHTENPNLQVYRAEDDVNKALTEYLESKEQQKNA